MMLYTWKDIERELLLNKSKWQGLISDTEIYTDEVIIHLKKDKRIHRLKKYYRRFLEKGMKVKRYFWIYRVNV